MTPGESSLITVSYTHLDVYKRQVQIKEGIVYINGERLEDPYGKEVIINPKRASEPVVLGEDEYFVLGDNRNNSSDSRDLDVGNVKKDQIIGKILIRIWPLNRFGGIE